MVIGRKCTSWREWAASVLFAAVITSHVGATADALEIELIDAAPDRIERQRAFEAGSLPLPGTPDLTSLRDRLAAIGVNSGDPLFIRAFKAESELEVWVRKDEAYVLLATYPVCHWSGGLGPKLLEGDKQTPEGFYTVTRRHLHRTGRWPRSLNLGFPNEFDKAHRRTGSYILVHGGCSSVGCFAMTNEVMAEIYGLAQTALYRGQEHIHVHVFPFRMTEANLAAHAAHAWIEFWRSLKPAYDQFEETRRVPRIGVCENRYVVDHAGPVEAGDPGPLDVCGAKQEVPRTMEQTASSNRPLNVGKRLAALPHERGFAVLNAQLPNAQLKCNLNRPSCRKWFSLMSASSTRIRLAQSRSRTPAASR